MNNSGEYISAFANPGSFFDQQDVQVERLPYGAGIPMGIKQVYQPVLGIGGAYGTWGDPYDNVNLTSLIEARLGRPLTREEILDLGSLGFTWRHHIEDLVDTDHVALEIEVGARILRKAAQSCGWEPGEIQGVLIGISGPAAHDYTTQIATAAGIPENALKVSIHKACDSSIAGLQLALNPELPINRNGRRNIASELYGKKVLVGGIEGLSRFVRRSRDSYAMQIFGNGAGVVGLIPGQNISFLVGKTHEEFDEKGTLAVRMYYPHSRRTNDSDLMEEVQEAGDNHIRLAGFMHEPEDDVPVVMDSPMGMVKLFVRTGVEVLQNTYAAYHAHAMRLGMFEKKITAMVVHHANLKINNLLKKNLEKLGIDIPMPWVLSEFGNVSAASNMIAFLRQLSSFKPGDHIILFGFGAGTYYDSLAVELNALR